MSLAAARAMGLAEIRAACPAVARAACLAGLFLAGAAGPAWPAAPDDLLGRYEAARQQAVRNPFDRPIVLQSTEASDHLQGDVFALVDQPFAKVQQALARPAEWCDILILHLNVKYCRASSVAGHAMLDTGLGRKFDQPLSDVHWMRFEHRVERSADDQLQVTLQAPTGPLGTRDYRLLVEAAPSGDRQTVLHMTYAYGFGLTARIAMQAYLATLGADKVGFSTSDAARNGRPQRVGGLRGVLERNTLRYYLAIECHLGASALPAAQQMPASLRDWYDATERYPEQLHEVDRDDYLAMKQNEIRRQAITEPPRAGGR